MVKAMVDISVQANQILNLIKAKYHLKTKSEAINKLAEEYKEEMLHPRLHPKKKKHYGLG